MEIWKDIEGFDGKYKISNCGNVFSNVKGCELKQSKEKYRRVGLVDIHNKQKHISVHSLVWDHFGKGKRNGMLIQVDHIDKNKYNNHIDNLQLLTNRENTSRSIDKSKTASKYIGVYWHKKNKKWISSININGDRINIGSFDDEYEAHLAYQKELRRL